MQSTVYSMDLKLMRLVTNTNDGIINACLFCQSKCGLNLFNAQHIAKKIKNKTNIISDVFKKVEETTYGNMHHYFPFVSSM